MENEKIALIALVVIIAGALTAFLISGNIEDIMDNLFSDQEQMDTIVEVGDCVDVNYIGRFADNQTVFDTSYEDVAKDEGVYNETMPYKPLKIFVDPEGNLQVPEGYSNYSSQMVEGFLEGLVGMKEGETKTVTIPPEKAYGIWNQTLAESYGLSPYPLESPVDITWDLERSLFSQYFSGVNLTIGTNFDWGFVMLGINNTINATITDLTDTNVTYEVNFVNGTSFPMPLFNWNVTVLTNNETTFLLRTSVEKDFVTTLNLGYGQVLHLKVVDVNETDITLALNQRAQNKKYIGQTLEFDLEVVTLYKTSKD
jgi:FKBP-type peptidyl-prolyl cis-trans isomerase 2